MKETTKVRLRENIRRRLGERKSQKEGKGGVRGEVEMGEKERKNRKTKKK